MHEKLIILDFGSQTTQLIGRRVRELNMYCEIVPYNKFPHDATGVKGVILSGSPYSVYDANAFKADLSEIRGKYPVLGICYGAQFLAYTSGGNVEPADSREYGRANLSYIDNTDELLKGINVGSQIWMSHGDTITVLPENFKVIASTDDVKAAAYHVEGEQTWGVQFHPEVFHSTDGTKFIKQLPEYLRMRQRLDTGLLYRIDRCRTERTIGRRQSNLSAFRRCGFFGYGCSATQGYRQEPDLHLRRPRLVAQE